MKIKQLPEDFVVEEINDLKLGEGMFAVVKVTKTNYNTEEVAQFISHKLRIPRKIISYSGSKDRNATTTQLFTIKTSKEKVLELEKLSDNKLKFEFLGYSNNSLKLGSHQGNKFTITIRDLNKDFHIEEQEFFPNYFGEQRFSTHNYEIGKLIIKKQFKEAVDLIKETSLKNKELQKLILENITAPVKVLRSIPKFTLMIYLHSYQSRLFNKLLSFVVKKSFSETFIVNQEQKLFFPKKTMKKMTETVLLDSDLEIPLAGFGVEVDKKIIKDYKEILQTEAIDEREFIIRSIPGMSLEGTNRKAFVKAENVLVSPLENDELNKDKKIVVSFELPKGSYATTYLKSLEITYS